MRTLIPGSRVPTFIQIEDSLREAVELGEFLPGSPVPSRAQLAQHFGVAPATVQKALDTLKGEGLLVGRHGRGVFVTDAYAPLGNQEFDPVDLNGMAAHECLTCGSVVLPARRGRHLRWHSRFDGTGGRDQAAEG